VINWGMRRVGGKRSRLKGRTRSAKQRASTVQIKWEKPRDAREGSPDWPGNGGEFEAIMFGRGIFLKGKNFHSIVIVVLLRVSKFSRVLKKLMASSGRCSRAASPTSSGPSVYSAFPRLALSPQLITQQSPPIPPCMFDVSLPLTSPWTFSISSLPTPRSASDCRRLDAMDRSLRHCVCPVIDAVHYRSV
jgi:hypothetical protein